MYIGAMEHYEFIRFGAMDVTKPYEFIRFGDLHGPKPYKFTGFGGVFRSGGPGRCTHPSRKVGGRRPLPILVGGPLATTLPFKTYAPLGP